MSRKPGEYELSDDEDDAAAAAATNRAAPYPSMPEADMQAAVDVAANAGGGEVVLTDRGLKGRQVLSLREPLSSWSASSIVHLDLSRNRLRDKGAGAVVKVLGGNSSITRLQLEHNGIGDPGAASLGELLRKHASITDVNLRRNAFTDTGARALVVALHENHALQALDITKNKTVSFSMHEAARLAAETNRMRHKGMLALDTLATLYETVEVIKGELGLMASMPIVQALDQACALLGVADGGEAEPEAAGAGEGEGEGPSPLRDGAEEAKKPDAAEVGAAGGEEAAPAATPAPAPAASKMLLTERAEAVVNELGMKVTPVKAQNSRDRVLRSLALGYAAQPADVAHLDGIASASGVSIKEILGFARAQLEAEKSLATADVNPIMEDDRTRRRRYRREQEEAARPVPQPTVLEQLAELLTQAVGRGLLTEAARSKIDEKVHDGKLNPTTCMVQWSQKLQVADEFEGLWEEASTVPTGNPAAAAATPAAQTVAPERQPDWKQVVDEQSGKTYYYNRRTRETSWSVPSGFVDLVPQRDLLFDAEDDEDDGQPGFEEWELPGSKKPQFQTQPKPQLQPQTTQRQQAVEEAADRRLFGFAPSAQAATQQQQQPAAAASSTAHGVADAVVVDVLASEMGQLAWRETALGTVQLVRAPARLLQPSGPEAEAAAAAGAGLPSLEIGMLLNSVGVPNGGGGGSRVAVGMLSYAGAVDQIDSTAAAQGRGVSLGFVRDKNATATAGGSSSGRRPGDYGGASSDSDSESDGDFDGDDGAGMFATSSSAARGAGGGGGVDFAASIGVHDTTDNFGGGGGGFGSVQQPQAQSQEPAAFPQSLFEPLHPTVRPGDRWVVIFGDGAVVRSGCEMSSTIVSKVTQGQVVTVVSARTNTDGLLRLCIEDPAGWLSVKAGDGTPLLREAPVGLSDEVTYIPPAGAAGGDMFALTMGGGGDGFGQQDQDLLLAPPPPPKSLAEQGAQMVERALEHDQAEEYAEAVSCYQQAAMHLHAAAKQGQSKGKASETQVGYYRSKATEYLQRAEELSHLLEEQRRRDNERKKLLDETSKQLSLAEQPTGAGLPLSAKAEKRRAKQNAKAVRRLRRNPEEATVDEVIAWLATIDCGGCAAAFVQHEIDGETLLELTEAQLRDDLGLTRMGDRARIRRERDRLRATAGDDVDGDDGAGGGGGPRLGGGGAPPPPPPPEEDDDIDELFGNSSRSSRSRRKGSGSKGSGSKGGGSKSKNTAAKEARKAKTGLRGTAPPPPPPVAEARVKVSARWVGAAAAAGGGGGGEEQGGMQGAAAAAAAAEWVHVKMDGDEATVVSSVRERLGTAMQMSPLAFRYMQYQDRQGDW